jgi:hypothetical protein
VAQVAAWRTRPDARGGLAAAFAVLAALLGCWQIKLMPYASWLAAVPLAVFAAGLRGRRRSLAPSRRRRRAEPGDTRSRFALPFWQRSRSFRPPLKWWIRRGRTPVNNARPAPTAPGLMPPIWARALYRRVVAAGVVAAPYHRLKKTISPTARSPGTAGARHQLHALGVDYVALCADRVTNGARPSPQEHSALRTRLLGGMPVDFLREMPLRADLPIRVWRAAPTR